MLYSFKNLKRNEDGATAVEFALISIGFVILLFGIVEVANAVWTINSVDYAVSTAGRYASLNSTATTEEIESIAEQNMRDYFVNPADTTFSITNTTRGGVDFIDITATLDYKPIISGFLPGEWSFQISKTMVSPIHD